MTLNQPEYPLALDASRVGPQDTLVLVLRSQIWDASNIDEMVNTLIERGVAYVILCLDDNDEAHVIRGGQ